MKRLVIALIGLAVVTGVVSFLATRPKAPVARGVTGPEDAPVFSVTPPAPAVAVTRPNVRPKRKTTHNVAQAPDLAKRSRPLGWPQGLPQGWPLSDSGGIPMGDGGIFSGADPKDPRIYHFAEAGQ